MWFYLIPLALILAVYIVGMLLPESCRVETSIGSSHPPDEVRRRLHDPESFPMSGLKCFGVQPSPGENALLAWVESVAGGATLMVRTVSAEEPRRVNRSLHDSTHPYDTSFGCRIRPTSEGSNVEGAIEITLAGTLLAPFLRVMVRVFGGTGVARQGMSQYLEALGGK